MKLYGGLQARRPIAVAKMDNRILVATDEVVGCCTNSAFVGGGSGLLLALAGEPGSLSKLLLFPNFKALFAKNIVRWGKPDNT